MRSIKCGVRGGDHVALLDEDPGVGGRCRRRSTRRMATRDDALQREVLLDTYTVACGGVALLDLARFLSLYLPLSISLPLSLSLSLSL